MKCEICGREIEKVFLGKIKGTYFRFGKKLKAVCSNCQKSEKNLKEKLGEIHK
ncbi:MAG: hypothetical protein OH319_02465 [Candidatus Parvarchaeota archaeon]|nr:hypothetical protein [Candidatus Jingweiarchaeum tengchongense]MCW1298231.1 hypothetical protein [Candidatus Jingweiarchaeum tengchongense]MCW1300029.1 hypothetical protein [Candidatus Jingweiarchaeum tengchongense]MCW1304832.1 hypothetical protein [Candidatus Jingweiarchaeum tengchongense]MCW1305422.1 hypothetical protein [Candidatus Jingweiarchaeum tengchongense]